MHYSVSARDFTSVLLIRTLSGPLIVSLPVACLAENTSCTYCFAKLDAFKNYENVEHCGVSVSKQCTAALNSYVAKALPVSIRSQHTGHSRMACS